MTDTWHVKRCPIITGIIIKTVTQSNHHNNTFNVPLTRIYWVELHTHTHTRLTAFFPGLPRWAGTKKVKPIWILLKQETVSGSSISWATCRSAPHSRQTTTPAPHHSVFYRPDALPAAQPTASKHWRQYQKKTFVHTQPIFVVITQYL